MQGLWVADRSVRFRSDLERPCAADGETRVKVLRAGVCATDLALVRGYMDFSGIPGHEFVGIALEGPLEGRRVVGEINAACGDCDWCRKQLERHCPNRTVLGIAGRPGAFAEVTRLPTRNLLEVPNDLPTDLATFVEPAAAAFEIGEQIELRPGTRALVQGDGRLGLLCAQVLADAGLEVEILGRHPERASWLPEGIVHLGSSLPQDRGRDFKLVVEATGDPEGIRSALERVAPRGTVVLKTTSERGLELDLCGLVVDEIRLVGSRCGPFAPALEALQSRRLIVEPMIEARYPLSRGRDALERASRRGVLKILIDINEDDPH